MDIIEKELIQSIKDGNHETIVLLFRLYYAPLSAYAVKIIKNREAAQEIVQDAFIKIWESHDQITITTSLKGYLYRCVHNSCINYIRDNSKVKKLFISLDQQTGIPGLRVDIKPEVLESLFSDEMEKSLFRAMESLPEQCRQIFYLSRFEDLRYDEIADRLSISLSTVKTQMSRAMHKLVESLKLKVTI